MLSDEEKKAIEYYENKEFSFEFDADITEFKKALGIEETEEDTLEKHKIRFNTLIKLIEKQQKEIEKEKEKSEKLYEDNLTLIQEINKEWKDKIKAKIEELYKERAEYADTPEWELYDSIGCQIEVLQSLLEEKE